MAPSTFINLLLLNIILCLLLYSVSTTSCCTSFPATGSVGFLVWTVLDGWCFMGWYCEDGSWRGEMVGESLGVLSWWDNDVIARGRKVVGGWLSSFRPGVICLAWGVAAWVCRCDGQWTREERGGWGKPGTDMRDGWVVFCSHAVEGGVTSERSDYNVWRLGGDLWGVLQPGQLGVSSLLWHSWVSQLWIGQQRARGRDKGAGLWGTFSWELLLSLSRQSVQLLQYLCQQLTPILPVLPILTLQSWIIYPTSFSSCSNIFFYLATVFYTASFLT